MTKLHAEWGRWPVFYGHSTWIAAGEPAGTAVENCLYWGADYTGSLSVPRGVGRPFAHQFAASSKGPRPWHFPGVADNPALRGPDGLPLGPDINSLLIPFADVRALAGLDSGGEDVLDPVKDKDTFKEMLDDALGTPSEAFWESFVIGLGNGAVPGRKHQDGKPAIYEEGFAVGQEIAKAAQGGGALDPVLAKLAEIFQVKQ